MKFNRVKFKDLTGFIQWFANQAAFSLADRKELWEAVQNGRLFRQKKSGIKEVILDQEKKKVGLLFQGHFPLDSSRGLLGTLSNKY